jgi:structural maintenance of chromosome 4
MAAQQSDVSGIRQQAEEAHDVSSHHIVTTTSLTAIQVLETRKDELQIVKKELDEKTTEVNESRAVEIEMRNKLEEGHKSLNEFQKKQAYFHDKLNKLTYQNVT